MHRNFKRKAHPLSTAIRNYMYVYGKLQETLGVVMALMIKMLAFIDPLFSPYSVLHPL